MKATFLNNQNLEQGLAIFDALILANKQILQKADLFLQGYTPHTLKDIFFCGGDGGVEYPPSWNISCDFSIPALPFENIELATIRMANYLLEIQDDWVNELTNQDTQVDYFWDATIGNYNM